MRNKIIAIVVSCVVIIGVAVAVILMATKPASAPVEPVPTVEVEEAPTAEPTLEVITEQVDG